MQVPVYQIKWSSIQGDIYDSLEEEWDLVNWEESREK